MQLGKAEKLKPMELELRRLEDLAESIVNDFAYMRAREEEMRDTNGENRHTLSHYSGLHTLFTQSQLTLVFSILASSQCFVYFSWRPGRYST